MKKTTIFAVTAACGALALALPDFNQPLNAAYPNPLYEMRGADSSTTKLLTVTGCKTLKTITKSDATLYDDQSYLLYQYDANNNLTNTLTGTWSKVTKGKKETFYMSINTASMVDLLDVMDVDAEATCSAKHPGAQVTVLEPTVLVKKNSLAGTTKNEVVKGTLQLQGQQTNNFSTKPGKVGLKVTLKGTLEYKGPAGDEQPNY